MKNILFLALLAILSSCTDKAQLKKELKEELKKEMSEATPKVKKGDGSYFYNEQVSIGSEGGFYVHHSTLDCPAIKNGVQRNFTYTTRQDKNLFCTKCMDDELISLFTRIYFPNNK